MERAAAAKEEKPKKITLSGLEKEIPATAIKDFSNDALEQYKMIAGIIDQVGSSGFNRRLVQQGLLMEKGGKFIPTGFGLLLFGREPRNVMPKTGHFVRISLKNIAFYSYPDTNPDILSG